MQWLLKDPAVVRGPAAPPSPVTGPDVASALMMDAAVSLTPVTRPVTASALTMCPVLVTGHVAQPENTSVPVFITPIRKTKKIAVKVCLFSTVRNSF